MLRKLGKIPPIGRILIAIALGIAMGEVAGDRTEPLSRVGLVILDILKGLAGPLLLLAIVDAMVRTRVRGIQARRMISISAFNAAVAISLGLGLANIFQPGRNFHAFLTMGDARTKGEFEQMTRLAGGRTIQFDREVLNILPTTLFKPLVDNAILSIVIVAVASGLALRVVKERQVAEGQAGYKVVEDAVQTLYQVVETLLAWVVRLVPLAVFAVVARTIGRYGFEPFKHVVPYVAVGATGLLIQVFVVYQAWIRFATRRPLARFWADAREPIVTSLGTGSSLASLPITLRALDRMNVSPESARLAACVGTNFNNDGILLYEAMAVLFVAQAMGIELTVGQQLSMSLACVIAGVGISGIPDAGLISLLIVMKTTGLPDELVAMIVPLLLSVDWFMGRLRAATNVISDLTIACVLDEGNRGNLFGQTAKVK